MRWVLNLFGKSLAAQAASRVRQEITDALQIRALRLYLRGVGTARQLFILGLLLACVLGLLLAGFVLAHVGLFLLLPLSLAAKGWLAVGLGAFYFLVAALSLAACCRQRTWLKASGAESFLAALRQKWK